MAVGIDYVNTTLPGWARPRPPDCYDPIRPARRTEHEGWATVEVFDHSTIRALLRDPVRVTSDTSEQGLDDEGDDMRHPIAAFVWGTDRYTLSGAPGRHAHLRHLMHSWFAPEAVADRVALFASAAEDQAAGLYGEIDLMRDYALPLATRYQSVLWLGLDNRTGAMLADDALCSGDLFSQWPPPTTAEVDVQGRELFARVYPDGTVMAQCQRLLRAGEITEREAWGIVHGVTASTINATSAIIATIGLCVDTGYWSQLLLEKVGLAVEEAVRVANPFAQASRFARQPFAVGEVWAEPGDQVLMWLSAANLDPRAFDGDPRAFDPQRPYPNAHLGWGAGYHQCAGMRDAQALATTAVAALARAHPRIELRPGWERYCGVDDGFRAAPVLLG